MRAGALALFAALVSGCGDSGQERVTIPLYVAGRDLSEPFAAAGDATVILERAALAFGPLYLCAGATAGDLCDTARVEWLGTVVADTIDPNVQFAGELTGVSGAVRSWMYDLGISSQLTRGEPFVLDAARELGDASLVLAGRAMVSGAEIPFSASIRVEQSDETELGVPIVRKSTSDTFGRELTPQETGLTVRFDPSVWLRRVDFRAYAGEEHATIEPGTEAFRAVHNALVSAEPPSFEWGTPR